LVISFRRKGQAEKDMEIRQSNGTGNRNSIIDGKGKELRVKMGVRYIIPSIMLERASKTIS